MLTCNCPPLVSLPDIPCVRCAEHFGQIQKIAFQRLIKADGTRNGFPKSGGDDTITALASWQAALTAADDTKIVVSPYIFSPTQESGAPRTFGGGNDSLGGVEEIIGRELSAFSASVRNCPQSVVSALKKMQCEGTLGVYLLDQYGNIECLIDEDGNAYPIPIKSFFVGDKVHGGIDTPDTNVIQWSFVKDYSDNLHIFIVEDFNPLTDFCGGASPEPPEPQRFKMLSTTVFHNVIPTTATAIVFDYKENQSVSGYAKIGVLDAGGNIEVWQNGTQYLVLSDFIMQPPDYCASMFDGYNALTSLVFANFDTSEVGNTSDMFYNCSGLESLDLSIFDTSNVISFSNMFYGCSGLTSLDLSNFDSVNVNGFGSMFEGCSGLTSLNLSNFDMTAATWTRRMFHGCTALTTIYADDWGTNYDGVNMFYGCTSLVGGNGTTYNASHTDGEYARIDRVGTPGYFTAPA